MFINEKENNLKPFQEGYKGVIPKPDKEQTKQSKTSSNNEKSNKK